MIQYWIVLGFTCLLGIVFKHENIPGDLITFINNTFLLRTSYVGAWWFMQTYVLLMICSDWLVRIVDKYKWYVVSLIFVFVYFVAYYFRIVHPIDVNNDILNAIVNAVVLFGTSVFPFIVGVLFRKYHVISFVRSYFSRFSNVLGLCIIVACCVGHIVVKSMFVDPFVAIVFIVGYCLLDIKGIFKKVLLFFGNHSTNIWLVHMQFYSIFFSSFVFSTNTVVGCFVILMGMCIASSYLINILFKWVNGIFLFTENKLFLLFMLFVLICDINLFRNSF